MNSMKPQASRNGHAHGRSRGRLSSTRGASAYTASCSVRMEPVTYGPNAARQSTATSPVLNP